MPSEHKLSAEAKKTILRGVYEDNLRIAEPPAKAPRSGKKTVVRRKHLRAVIAVLVAVLAFLPYMGPHIAPDAELPQPDLQSPASEPDDQVSFPEAAAGQHPLYMVPDWANMLLHEPIADLAEFDRRNFADYYLMISDKDVRLMSLFGLDVKTIVIDPGHGGADPGAVGALGTKEKDVTLDVALKLKARMKKTGRYNVLLTRDGDSTVSLAKRVEFANANKADLFISIHVNSLPNQLVSAIETYHFGPPPNAEAIQLAKQENKDSQYAIGEFKTIIQDIGNTVKRQESLRLAVSIQKALFNNVKGFNAEIQNSGVKTAPFVVLVGVETPSVLVEISCITNEEEEGKLASAEYREKVASFLEEGIARYTTQQLQQVSRRHLRQAAGGDQEHAQKTDGNGSGNQRDF